MSVYLSQGFESTSTLVAPPPPRTFVFSRSSVTNATIFSYDRPVYKIKSGDGGSRTELFDLDEQKPVASIKRRQFLPDVVAFCDRSNKAIRIDKWLNRRKVPNGQIVDRLHTLAGTFIWKSETLGTHRFALYIEDQDDSPIAYSSLRGDRYPPTIGLTLKPGWDHILVEIITSFLVLEYNYRMEHKAGREMILSALTGYNFVD